MTNNVDMVDYVVNKYKFLKDIDKINAAVNAAARDRLDIIKYIDKSYPNLVDKPSVEGLTVLMFCAIEGRMPIIEYLVNNYPESINDKITGKKALDLALVARVRNEEVIKFLGKKHYELGMELYEKQQYEEALDNINSAIKADDKNREYYDVRANIKIELEQAQQEAKDDPSNSLLYASITALAGSIGLGAYFLPKYLQAQNDDGDRT